MVKLHSNADKTADATSIKVSFRKDTAQENVLNVAVELEGLKDFYTNVYNENDTKAAVKTAIKTKVEKIKKGTHEAYLDDLTEAMVL